MKNSMIVREVSAWIGALLLIVCLACPALAMAREPGYMVTYDGGSLYGVKAGAGLRLAISASEVDIFNGKRQVISIPASGITEISYGQDVHRRVGTAIGLGLISFGVGAFTLLSKSKKHFVGLTWAAEGQKGGLAVQCSKKDYRGILMGLEGVSGKKAVDSDMMTVKN